MNTTELSVSIEQTDSVELIVDKYSVESNDKDLFEEKHSTSVASEKHSINNKARIWRTIFMLLIICSVDIIIFYYMNNIYQEATDQLNKTPSSQCIYELQCLFNPMNIIIPALCLLSTLILAISAWNLYCKRNSKFITIIIYFAAIVIHSILYSYESVLISNIRSHNTSTCVTIDVDTNIMVMRYALMVKGLLFTLAFITTFIYNLCFKLLSNRDINKRRCVVYVIFSLSVILMILSIFITIDVYVYNGIHIIHGIAALLGLFHVKCHAIKDTHHLTTTYNADYKQQYKLENEEQGCELWTTCCPGGCCCHGGNGGCCEWKFKGGFCVVCTYGCGDYPKSTCFSCCGMCTCFCCDPGGCYGACCCSYDFCTWCGCGCC